MVYRFRFQKTEARPNGVEMHGAYAVGADSVPVRAELRCENGEVLCETRSHDPIGLSLLWPVPGFGTVQLETTRLPPRDQPYQLEIELARQRLLRLNLKREEWGLFDYDGMEEITAQIDDARRQFILALQHADDAKLAAAYAEKSLLLSMIAAERLTQFHARIFLNRRQQTGGFARQFMGVRAPNLQPKVVLARRLQEAFDFVRVPLVWREILPKEQEPKYELADAWIKGCVATGLAVRGGPLLNFGVQSVPDWMYIWENDYDSILDYARDHIRRTVQRYAGHVSSWVAASGLHGDNVFTFNFEQIMDLTRMAATVTKQAAPRAQVILDIMQPWGEYYARNQRTVPPLLYADMIVQSGIPFDAFGLQFVFGISSDGYHLRDLLQVSTLIDRLANLGKPLHITALCVPSIGAASAGSGSSAGGDWRGPWSDQSQADFLVAFSEVALSKPYVESICLEALSDSPGNGIPSGGVWREDLTPKTAFTRLVELRRRLQKEAAK